MHKLNRLLPSWLLPFLFFFVFFPKCVQVSVAGQRRQTGVIPATRCPSWNQTFEFFNTQLHDTLVIKVSHLLPVLGAGRGGGVGGQGLFLGDEQW